MNFRMLLSLFPAVLLVASPDESQPVGHVVDWRGSGWEDKRDERHPDKVEKGMAVFRDSKLVLTRRADPKYSITIRSYINGQKAQYSCDAPCTKALNLGETLAANPNQQASGFFGALIQVITDTAAGGSARTLSGYARALSKGPHGEIIEGIAPLTVEGADISGALKKMRTGAYKVQFCKLAKDGTAQCPDTNTAHDVAWSPENPKSATVPGVIGGLYEIGVYENAPEKNASDRESAIVLVVPKANVGDATGKYAEAIRNTAEWDAGEAALARHAYLQYLNRSFNH